MLNIYAHIFFLKIVNTLFSRFVFPYYIEINLLEIPFKYSKRSSN